MASWAGSAAGQLALGTPEGKNRSGPLSAQTWKSSGLSHPAGSPGQHCELTGQAEVTQTPGRGSAGQSEALPPIPGAALRHSVLILPALGTPNSPPTKIHRWSCVPSHMLTALQERRKPCRCRQGSCNSIGKTAISVSESAAILPLWMPVVFCLFNNNKHKVQENGFLLEGGWEDRGENGK